MPQASATVLTVTALPIRYGMLVSTARVAADIPDGLGWAAERSARAAEDQVADRKFLVSWGL